MLHGGHFTVAEFWRGTTILQNLDPNITKEGRNQLISLLIAHFNELAIEERRRWLEEKWPTMKDAAWLPTLRATARRVFRLSRPFRS
jgi:hypothetical protein